jgi:hypothetical protein
VRPTDVSTGLGRSCGKQFPAPTGVEGEKLSCGQTSLLEFEFALRGLLEVPLEDRELHILVRGGDLEISLTSTRLAQTSTDGNFSRP